MWKADSLHYDVLMLTVHTACRQQVELQQQKLLKEDLTPYIRR
jgi:BarA-like signal transduction histidine kinase